MIVVFEFCVGFGICCVEVFLLIFVSVCGVKFGDVLSVKYVVWDFKWFVWLV